MKKSPSPVSIASFECRTPVSDRIRARLIKAGTRFNANDNIADFIEPGELAELKAEVEARIDDVLNALVIDTHRDHNTRDTARRVAKLYLEEVFRGRYEAPPSATDFPNVANLQELMVVGPITIRSACSHHLCPIMGKLWVGVMPNAQSKLIGLSKFARLADWVLARPQIQEEAITQLADVFQDVVKPDGLAVVIQAQHSCLHWRGVKDTGAQMTNSIMRGVFLTNPSLRSEFLALIRQSA
ncbi:MAG: GTP cyclohydrolase I [Hyphomicrobiaceae bacterium]